jgi:hypothetical protein
MAAKTGTYTLIGTTTLTTTTASVTFSSIPATYTDLVIVCNNVLSNRGSSQDIPVVTFNGDTGANYSSTQVDGSSSGGTSTRWTSTNNALMGFISDNNTTANLSLNPSFFILNIMDYSNSTTYKTLLSRYNSNQSTSSYTRVGSNVGLWRSTSAINSLSIALYYASYLAGSTFRLYGLEAAK